MKLALLLLQRRDDKMTTLPSSQRPEGPRLSDLSDDPYSGDTS